ncbi:undecaprenyl-phosphate glucose phosphotransferase [Beijerinckia mobilis]|uniref:undecaprenyl-phosphate glucose phosphotransferase n=1 Tax=Beijerinckia mobilis TaxID=231434 RepID=UPI00055068A6|nr:undecaprenyl-phosphate glucose phosphotransferase [Beijerinckia mobilis]
MYFGRVSEMTDPDSHAAQGSWITQHINISYQNIEWLAAVVDILFIILASVAGGAFYQYIAYGAVEGVEASFSIGVTNSLLYAYVARSHGLYRLPVLLSPWRHLTRILFYWIAVGLFVAAGLFLLKVGNNISRGSIICMGLLQISLLIGARFVEEKITRSMVATGRLAGRRVVTIGESSELQRLSGSYLFRYFGLKEVARIALTEVGDVRANASGENTYFDQALNAARDLDAEEFVVALKWSSRPLLETVRDRLRISPLPVTLLPDHNIRSILGRRGIATGRPDVCLELQRAPLTTTERAAKRSLDIVAASIAILLLSPVFLVTALAIKLDSSGPIIFKQRRNGFNSRIFLIYKFRTMTVMEDGAVVRQAQRNDQRVTRVGAFLRRSSIDELPQLINVLKGDMSLVGPRPHALAHDNEYKTLIAKYAFRHHVKPGMTGWAQVNGLRGETGRLEQMVERVKLDLWYINHWSLAFDISILIRTCFEVLRNRAY